MDFFSLSLVFFNCLLLANAQTEQQSCASTPSNGGTLEFLFMTSFSESLNSSGNAVGMMIALDRIAASESVLTDYNLTYSAIIDTQCNRSLSLTQFIDSVMDPCKRRFINVVGAGCTVASQPVAEILHYWGLSQISYLSNSASLKDARDYPQYIQLYPSDANFSPGIVGGILYFGWNQVGIITQSESIFTTARDLITSALQDFNVTVLSTVFDSSVNDITDVPDLFPPTAHIFFINTYETKARQILCEAYHRGLYGRNYLWLLYGWYDTEWWRARDLDNRCTVEQMDAVIDGSLTIEQLPINPDVNKKVVGGLSYNEYLVEYARKTVEYNFNSVTTSHIAYDAVWTLAFALEEADRMLNAGNLSNCEDLKYLDSLSDWSYTRNATASCLVYQALLNTDFEGLSGRVQFDENGTRLSVPIRFSQYREGELILFALSSGDSSFFVDGENNETVFPDGIPPDGTPILEITTHHPALTTIVYVLAFSGLVLNGICLGFIIFYRNNKIVSLSTNVLNYCIICGASLIFVSLFFRVAPSTSPDVVLSFCYVSLWLLNIGYTIAYSAILTKMGRIYYVFFHPSKQKIDVTNLHLLSVVGVLTIVMVVILVLGSAIPTTQLETYLDEDLERPSVIDESGVLRNFEYYRCFDNSSGLWLLVMYLYIGLIQICAVVLVLQTRQIKIRVLNDSKAVAGIVYVTSVGTVTLLIVSFSFPSYQNTTEAVFSSVLLIISYCVVLVTFIPKMYLVFKGDGKGNTMLQHSRNQSRVRLDKKGVLTIINEDQTIEDLYKQVDELETALETRKMTLSKRDFDASITEDTIKEDNTAIANNNSTKETTPTNGTLNGGELSTTV